MCLSTESGHGCQFARHAPPRSRPPLAAWDRRKRTCPARARMPRGPVQAVPGRLGPLTATLGATIVHGVASEASGAEGQWFESTRAYHFFSPKTAKS